MSVMTRGIITQPYSLAMHSDYSRRQFYSHAQVLLADHDSARKHWENESNNVQALMDEVARLKAEIAGLKTGYEAYEQVVQGLKAEVEVLRREREGKVLCDLELFETLRDAANTEADEHRQCMATYRPLRQENLDSVVKKCDDLLAAMGSGAQS